MDNDIQRCIIEQLHSKKSEIFFTKSLNCLQKDDKASAEMREEGNVIFTSNNYDSKLVELFQLYTNSIALAPQHSKNLAFAYGNRSVILHRMKKYKESILDIDRAIARDVCEVSYKIKLLARKVQCLAAQGSLSESKKVYNEIECLLFEVKDQNNSVILGVQKAKDALNNVKQLNPSKHVKNGSNNMSSLCTKKNENICNSVILEQNETFGHHLIANRDINPGEIIFIEQPYVSCLENFHNYCGHCFTHSWANIPCDFCNWCMFCSEKCKELAWINYHNIECIVVSYLKQHHDFDYNTHLSLRSLLKGINESRSITNFKVDILSMDEIIDKNEKNILQYDLIQNTGFKSVYALNNTIQKENLNFDCAIILIILCKYTSFFGQECKFNNIIDLVTNEDVLFIGSVLMKLRQRIHTSARSIFSSRFNCKFANDTASCTLKHFPPEGAYVAPIISYINHSCNPNVEKCMSDNQKLILFSLKPIKKNTQLLMAYQHPFYEMEKSIRQGLVEQHLNLICNCEACTNNWPTLNELYRMPMVNPVLYAKMFDENESSLFDENNHLVSNIINADKKTLINQTTLRYLVKAMEKASNNLKQPSVVICELMTCLVIVFEKLYNSGLSR